MAKLLSTIIDGFLASKNFISGALGSGWKIWKTNGRYKFEVDDVVVRNTMTVFELLISKIRAIKGALGITQASGKIKSVREDEDNYYIQIEDEMSFVANDIIRCMEFSGSQKSYWVIVSDVENSELVIPKTEFSGASLPSAGDEIVQFGNTRDTRRQSAIYLHADENGEPAIDVLFDINSKSFDGKTKIRVGGDIPGSPGRKGFYCENGMIKSVNTKGDVMYLLRPDGSGFMAKGNISWNADGSGEIFNRAIYWDTDGFHFGSGIKLTWDNLDDSAKENLKGEPGDPGSSIDWKGDLPTPPVNPKLNWAYRNTTDGKVYIYSGSDWIIMVKDGLDGINGKDVYITYHDGEAEPAKPTGNGTSGGWHRDSTKSVTWMSQKVAKDVNSGEWGDPINIKGIPGKDANLLPWVEEWNGQTTQIGSDYVVSPRMFSGTRDANNKMLNGIAFGRGVVTVLEDGVEKQKTGIFGVKDGKITFSIDEDGNSFYSGEINVNNKFKVNSRGELKCIGAKISGEVNATSGVFSGSIQTTLKKIEESDAIEEGFNPTAYDLVNDLHVDATGYNIVHLPTNLSYVGKRCIIVNTALGISRSPVTTRVRSWDGSRIMGVKLTLEQREQDKYCNRIDFFGGYVELLGIFIQDERLSSKCHWMIVGMTGTELETYTT